MPQHKLIRLNFIAQITQVMLPITQFTTATNKKAYLLYVAMEMRMYHVLLII